MENNEELENLESIQNNEFKKLQRYIKTISGDQLLANIHFVQKNKAENYVSKLKNNEDIFNDEIIFSKGITESKNELKELIDENNLPLNKRIEYREVYKLINLVENNLKNNEDKITNAFLSNNVAEYINVVLDNTLNKKEKLNQKQLIIKKLYDRTSIGLRKNTFKTISSNAMKISQTVNFHIEECISNIRNTTNKTTNLLKNEFKKLFVFLKIKNVFNKLSKACLFTATIGDKANNMINSNGSEASVRSFINEQFSKNFDSPQEDEIKKRKKFSI